MALSEAQIEKLLEPYLAGVAVPDGLFAGVSVYLELLLRWNQRTNLTAVREPEEIVQRQIGESLFAARLMPETGTLLDFGSGGGFPGIPLRLMREGVQVTLAESQGKKAAFLREADRNLRLGCEVWSGRVEEMPSMRAFGVVAMRAVDQSERMVPVALGRVEQGGELLRFTGADGADVPGGWVLREDLAVPLSVGRVQVVRRA